MNEQGLNNPSGPGRTRPRRLLLCLDGVPLDLVRAAKGRGLFDKFNAPARLLSPFPTMTNIALSTMLGATPPNGYESLYFDRKAREVRGGISKYVGRRTPDKLPSSYMEQLDYQEPLHFEFLVYVAPEAVWRADMRRFRERFRAAPQTRDFFAFLKGTDGLLHIRGAGRLEVALESLDRILTEIHDWCGDETEIVLFSDHGMTMREHRRINLQTHLRGRGYETAARLQGKKSRSKSVAIPAFGLCGYAALYCADEDAAAGLADDVTELEGVDLALHRDGDSAVLVKSERGAARIERRENGRGVLYRYEHLTGDPLQLADAFSGLMRDGEADDKGFAPDAAWYARTAEHVYPDAVANLFHSLHSPRVGHTADVLVSTKDGYYYGFSAFDRLVRRLAATHGNALKPSTSAFLMSTHRAFPATVRAADARPILKG
ncbi:MAG TPA: hypothetical protein VF507_05275 [Pyrinomonadaceae bacterium]|jgi:hypothetical protein